MIRILDKCSKHIGYRLTTVLGINLFQCYEKISIPDAFECAKMLCDQYYLTSPELNLTQVNGKLAAARHKKTY